MCQETHGWRRMLLLLCTHNMIIRERQTSEGCHHLACCLYKTLCTPAGQCRHCLVLAVPLLAVTVLANVCICVFDYQVVAVAKKEGKYDATGIIKPGCESIEFKWVVGS